MSVWNSWVGSCFEIGPTITDCVSLAIMGDRQIYDAFTADYNFEQAGFKVLLK